MHWCSWKALSVPKEEGGMGFRDLSKFNIALLAKQGWRLLENPGSLTAQLICAKYCNGSNFLEASLSANPSLLWRSISGAKGFLKSGLRWRIRSGSSVSIWQDYWLPGKNRILITTNRVAGMECVSDLILHNPNRWNRELIYSTFMEEEGNLIVSIPLPITNQSDNVVWSSEKSSVYLVKNEYKILIEPSKFEFSREIYFQANLEFSMSIKNSHFSMEICEKLYSHISEFTF